MFSFYLFSYSSENILSHTLDDQVQIPVGDKNHIFCFLNSFVLRSERLPTVALQQSRWSSVSAAHFLAYYSGSNFYPKNKILLFKTKIFYESIFTFYFLHDCQQASPYQRLAVKKLS